VIERVRMERPHDYLRIVVAALPKDMNMRLSTQQRRLEFLTDAELTAIIRDSARRPIRESERIRFLRRLYELISTLGLLRSYRLRPNLFREGRNISYPAHQVHQFGLPRDSEAKAPCISKGCPWS
jgi:hypothetical protein